MPNSADDKLMIFMSPHLTAGGHIDFGANPFGIDVSVSISIGIGVGVGIGITLSCLHNILWTSNLILTKFSWIYNLDIRPKKKKKNIRFSGIAASVLNVPHVWFFSMVSFFWPTKICDTGFFWLIWESFLTRLQSRPQTYGNMAFLLTCKENWLITICLCCLRL